MSSFSIYNDENFNNLSSNNVNSSSGNFSGLTAGNANINLLTSGNANINLLTLTPRLTPNVAGDGALIYDITTNQFKGRINSTWQTLASGAGFSATDQQVLYYNEASGKMEGATDLLWHYDPNNNETYLAMTPGVQPSNNPPEGAIKYFGGDLKCFKGSGPGAWTSLTQIGTGANAAGAKGDVQFNDGINQFAADQGKFTYLSALKKFILLGEPDYTPLIQSIATQPGNNVLTGVKLMSQVVSNETKGITSLWPGGIQIQNLQIYRFHGHDFKAYSSFDPIEDSILYTEDQNKNPGPSYKPPATMDLGMSSRVPFSTSNGSTGTGWINLQWSQSGEDDPYILDPYSDTGGYGEWDGQLMYKSGVPGLYIEERRWDRIFGRTNYTGELSLRSTYAPNLNPNGVAVTGIDFYDVELANLTNVTESKDVRLGSKMGFGMARLNVSRNSQSIGDLMVITTEKTSTLPGDGVNYSTPGQYGAASMYFRYIGPNAQPGGTGAIISDNYTALIDGVNGEFKALGSFQAGSSSPGVTNTMTLKPDNLIATWKGPGPGQPVVGTFGVGVSNGVGFGQISLKGNNGVESLSMKGINASSGPAPFKSIDMSTGLAYFDNSFAAIGGVNSDNVGVMSISQSLTNGQNNTNVLQISSAIDIGDPASYTGVNQNVLALKNSTGVGGAAVNLLTVDTGGFSKGIAHIRAAVGGVPSSTVAHTLVADMQSVGGAAATYGGSVLSLESNGLNGNTGTYAYFDPIAPLSGYSFLQARNTSNVGGKKLILDSDGSIKCSVSLTVSQNSASGSLPGDGGVSINLVPSVGNNTINGTTGGSLITTTFSLPQGSASSPLQLQASGPTLTNGTGFAVLNPVRVIPNRIFGTPVYRPTTSFQICDLNTSGNPTNNENLMYWTKNTDISNDECLLMSARPAGSKSTGQSKPIWTFQSGGTIGLKPPVPGYCFRYFPEGNSFDAVNPITGIRLILSDDNPVTNANGGIVRVGKGKSRPKSTFTVGGGGWLESDVIDTRWTFTEVIDYGSTNPATGGNLIIGAGLTDCVQLSVDNGGNGNGYVDLEKTGCIISNYAANPVGAATGPTNICNRNHNGYIGCPGVFPSDGTGIRGYSVLATTFSAVAKLYTAKNLGQQPGEQGYVCCSAVEAPQGVIIMRGRVRLVNAEAEINLDTGLVAPGTLVVPHTNPNTSFPVGTVNAMYQNFTVSVSNAGILPFGGNYPDLEFDVTGLSAGGGQVAGIIKINSSLNEVTLNIRNFGQTPDIFVDWVVYCERKDVGYKKAGTTGLLGASPGFVTSYTNPISGTYDTWGTTAYAPRPGVPQNGVNLDGIYGEDNYIFE